MAPEKDEEVTLRIPQKKMRSMLSAEDAPTRRIPARVLREIIAKHGREEPR
jgi:hypothetical protein